jgi:sugar phosphate isomerase/epimerase
VSGPEPEFGIFARVFPAGPAAVVAGRVHRAGYDVAHLNLSALGHPTIPDEAAWAAVDAVAVRADFASRDVGIWGLSATYNMAHPDPAARREATLRAARLVPRAPGFGAAVVTLCTGSRDAEHMWRAHPDNGTPAAWRDFRAELDVLLAAAEAAGMRLGVEPEPGNVVADAEVAARLLRELGPDAALIGIVVDAANLLSAVPPSSHAATLDRAFDLLGAAAVCLHAKDLVAWDRTLAGDGVVDYARVARLHRGLPEPVPVIVQDVTAEQAADARDWLAERFGA